MHYCPPVTSNMTWHILIFPWIRKKNPGTDKNHWSVHGIGNSLESSRSKEDVGKHWEVRTVGHENSDTLEAFLLICWWKFLPDDLLEWTDPNYPAMWLVVSVRWNATTKSVRAQACFLVDRNIYWLLCVDLSVFSMNTTFLGKIGIFLENQLVALECRTVELSNHHGDSSTSSRKHSVAFTRSYFRIHKDVCGLTYEVC